jgi:alkyl hydroperoxide reductase subunit AhpC
MPLQLGDTAPDFTAQTTDGPLSFHEWLGASWGVVFSHPADFTPVCTTELGAAAKMKPEFDRRGVKMLAVSVDELDDHATWIKDINQTQHCTVNFPLVADDDRTVASLYGMIHPKSLDSLTVRTVFIIDPNKKVRLTMTYPASCGRNFDEILRVIDSLQLTDAYKVATPANWKDGDDVVIVPSLQDPGELAERFPKGYTRVRNYLRMTPQPNK